jgi:hypothetical protein
MSYANAVKNDKGITRNNQNNNDNKDISKILGKFLDYFKSMFNQLIQQNSMVLNMLTMLISRKNNWIATWNANGIIQHKEELKIFLHDQLIDIMLISETHFTEKLFLKIPEYNLGRVTATVTKQKATMHFEICIVSSPRLLNKRQQCISRYGPCHRHSHWTKGNNAFRDMSRVTATVTKQKATMHFEISTVGRLLNKRLQKFNFSETVDT